jgi:hypothetical protein
VFAAQNYYTGNLGGPHGTVKVIDWRTGAGVTATKVTSALSVGGDANFGGDAPPLLFNGAATTVLIADVSTL